jgi:hypothetical protein
MNAQIGLSTTRKHGELRSFCWCTTIPNVQGPSMIVCDGCGQAADQEHITRRLRRLEKMTRYRPLHVQALFLAAVSPQADGEHLYSADEEFRGDGAALLRALEIDSARRGVEATLAEFQRRGYLLTHVLECPGEYSDESGLNSAMERRIAATMARIRRSFKPRRVVLLGEQLEPFVARLKSEDLGAELLLTDAGQPFPLAATDLVTKLTAVTPSL